MVPEPSTGPRRRLSENTATPVQNSESERPAAARPPRDESCIDVRVAEIIEETHDVKTFRLTGQSLNDFHYQPGQFITCLLDINGRTVQRAYSLSSSPTRPGSIELTVKRVPGGLVSNWLCDRLQPGDRIRLKRPSGRFTCTPEPPTKLLFIAAGSGITPIMSMCRWLFDTPGDIDVKVLASFRTPQDIIFRKELALMAARKNSFRLALTMTGDCATSGHWMGFTGRINRQMIALFAPDYRERQIFLCGPDSLMEDVRIMLRELDFDVSRLRCESFRIREGSLSKGDSTMTTALRGTIHDVTFTRTGVTVQTDEHMTLLELAERHGIEIDYNCRCGTCGECEVKCRGEVAINPECEIDAEQRAAGFVYACTTSARSDLELDA
jgi:ferredoxin-NADP reductase